MIRSCRALPLAIGTFAATASFALSQVTFPTEEIGLPTNDGVIPRTVEVADTSERRAQGYMGRTDIGPDDGMLFVFEPPRRVQMWMKNTPTSLDMVFIEPDGTIESIARETEPFSTAIVGSDGTVGFVLEVLAGQADALGLKPGERIEGPRFD